MSLVQKPFARWETFDACKLEQMEIGHSEESADKICGDIQERAEKGMLFKSLPDLEILKGKGGDLIVGGYASWEIVDAENDFVTTEAMVNFLAKFFNLPVEYRNVSGDHTNFQLATALLEYEGEDETFYSHVHEKGMYLIAKVRSDGFKRTRQLRKLVREGVYKAYSISGYASRFKHEQVNGTLIRKIFDIDPYEVAIVKEGMNQKSVMQVLKKKPTQIYRLREIPKHIKPLSWKEETELAIKSIQGD